MTRAPWYLGPLGHLRELPVPNPGITDTVTRYGGIHQGISGARTVDITGHRGSYVLEWTSLLPEEFDYLRALHLQLIPGPYRIIDPRYKNRLSVQSSTMHAVRGHPTSPMRALGVTVPQSAAFQWVNDWPEEVTLGTRSLRVFNYLTGGAQLYPLRLDLGYFVPVFPGETVTFSVYARTEASESHCSLAMDFLDDQLVDIGDSAYPKFTLSQEWQRISVSAVVPGDCVAVSPKITPGQWNTPGDEAEPIRLAAPQVESGDTPTSWQLGGGAKTVGIESLSSSSPQYPYQDCTLTLVEL